MADISKKDKLIEDAHKHALLGQFDKTAKIYEQILASEPAAINLRQKLAEYLIKSGRNDDARKELETIGNHFSNNGFFLKAIAIYKQLQKLFPADISLSLKLAELNEKHGLVANSLSEYRLVYEFYENAGDISAAFDILDRMQKVDPRNIPVKIKLAEAYAQQEKKAESYALFAKTAALLLEQGDNAAFSNICIRVRQLFPDKPDFLLELLAEQIRSGNATAAIGSLQNIIRSNPHNKPAWDLIVQAYQLLEQPQRVKTACQHYLNFFPAEPAAILGLISSVTAEQNPAEALKLLDRYEATLISAGFLQQLEQIYLSLDKIDPINIKVVEGLIRIATAAGNENEVRLLTSKLQLLSAISGDIQNGSTESESPSDVFCTTDSPVFGESPLEQEMTPDFENLATDTTSAAVLSDAAIETAPQSEDEIEIDVEIDFDFPFASLDQEADETLVCDNWLDSIDDLFGTINTAPRTVKFGNEMDNSDAQTHFDLGQAFKEMGLYDEAINEFRQASHDTSMRLVCLIMQCACLRERGEPEKAISMLSTLLKPGLSEKESCAVKYELASGYEAAGNAEKANLLLNEINAINPGFRDLSSRLNAASHPDSLDFSDEELKNFGLK